MTLSVITICYNNLAELILTCRSVDAQTVLPEEHLIIDGSSGSEIIDWLQGQPQPPYRRWIHERDNGISDAFNKGIANAGYELTHLLNAGDRYYASNAIALVKNAFARDTALMWTHSLYVQHRGDMDVVSGVPFDQTQVWKGMRTVAHPTMFIKKEVYDRHGGYDTSLRIAMDYDMLLRMRNEKFRFINAPLVYFAPGGASNTQFEKGLKEVRNSYRKHIGGSIRLRFWQMRQKTLHAFMKTGLGRKWFQWKNRRNKTGR